MHKNTTEKSTSEAKNDTKIRALDIERENRLAKVTSLYSKGLNQEEIALVLHVDQSTVSRDLQFIKQEARKQVETTITLHPGNLHLLLFGSFAIIASTVLLLRVARSNDTGGSFTLQLPNLGKRNISTCFRFRKHKYR